MLRSLIVALPEVFPLYLQGQAMVHIYRDGSVLLTHGGVEMGQGINTKMIQVMSLMSHAFDTF